MGSRSNGELKVGRSCGFLNAEDAENAEDYVAVWMAAGANPDFRFADEVGEIRFAQAHRRLQGDARRAESAAAIGQPDEAEGSLAEFPHERIRADTRAGKE